MSEAQKTSRVVGIWLLVCCALVFAMVVLGGVTRLTGSGLSMVDWQPIMGVLPPLNDAQWEATFARYQQSPEFEKINYNMDVESFKGIFWLEYLHRLLGRTIGVVFLLPMLFFLVTGRIRKRDLGKYLLMFALGGLQGLLGWYMVKSGLVDNPHVSQYRLTAHLMAAVAIYAFMFWVAMGILHDDADARRNKLYKAALALTMLITVTVFSGGFMAGIKAGLAFNTFPMMGNQWIPDGMFALEPVWRNFFDNLITVQFDHRLLALTTLTAVVVFWLRARRMALPADVARGVHALLGVAVLQVSLGIATLVLRVPTVLASMHQAVAMLLFTAALFLTHRLRGGYR